MKRTRVLTALIILWSAHMIWGQIPGTLSYQGVLTDAGGDPMPDDSYSMVFRLYTTGDGDTPLWEETQSVDVMDGLFSVILGSVTSLDLPFDNPYWLGIALDGSDEMTPRARLTSSAYSLNSRSITGESNIFPSEGNVGINTISPAYRLHIVGTTPNEQLRFESSVQHGNPSIVVRGFGIGGHAQFSADRAGTSCQAALNFFTTGERDWRILVNEYSDRLDFVSFPNGEATTGVSFLQNGSVGIGTTNPSARLHVGGQAGVDGIQFPDGTLQTTAFTGGGLTDGDWTIVGNNMYSAVSGDVGIGTTSPQRNLHLARSDRVTLVLEDTGAPVDQKKKFINTDDGYLRFGKFPDAWTFTPQMTIDNDGNVGIGASTPSARLNVIGSAAVGSDANAATGPNAIALGEGCGAGDDASVAIGKDAQASAAYATAIGIEATANNLGSISIGHKTNSYGWYSTAIGSYIQVGGNRSVGIGLDDVSRDMTANGAMAVMGGNVGIGTMSPSNILTVVQGSATDPIADAWTTYSSKRWKSDIVPIRNALSLTQKLRGVSFSWKSNGRKDIGLIAEEVGEIVPEIVAYEGNGLDARSVDYGRLVALLIEAIKEQQKQIEELRSDLNLLR